MQCSSLLPLPAPKWLVCTLHVRLSRPGPFTCWSPGVLSSSHFEPPEGIQMGCSRHIHACAWNTPFLPDFPEDSVILNQGQFCPPGDTWLYLEALFYCYNLERGGLFSLASNGQNPRTCSIPYKAQEAPTTKNDLALHVNSSKDEKPWSKFSSPPTHPALPKLSFLP